MRILRGIVIITSAIFILSCGYLCWLRITYPYPLWVLEDEIFIHALKLSRLNEDIYIYIPWNSSFIPLIYTPLYYLLGAIILKVSATLAALRLLSLGAIVATFLAAKALLGNVKTPGWIILIVIGFMSAISPVLWGSWEQAKVDGLMLALVLWAAVILTRRESMADTMLAAVILVLAFFAKQTAAPFIIALTIFVLITNRCRFPVFLATLIVSLLALGTFAYFLCGYNFLFYTWSVPVHQTIYWRNFLSDIIPLWLRRFPIIFILATSTYWIYQKSDRQRDHLVLLYLLPASFLAYLLPRCKYAGYSFNILPFAVVSCVLAGWALSYFIQYHAKSKRNAPLVTILILMQFALLAYNPVTLIPNSDNYQISRDVVAEISELDGDVYLPIRGYFGYLGGKSQYASFVAIEDVLSSKLESSYPQGLMDKLTNGEIKYILLPEENRDSLDSLPPDFRKRLMYKGFLVDLSKYNPNPSILLPPICLYEILPEEKPGG